MSRELSVLIPARNEEWLGRTITDVLDHRAADTEVIVILDGAWPTAPLAQHPDVRVIHRPQSIGQRAATNLAARLSEAKYVMKLDAHCSVAPGFDAEMIRAARELGPEVTQIPAQKNLHVYDWICEACGHRKDQGPPQTQCEKCSSPKVRREELWVPRPGSTTTAWRFDADLHFQYWKEFKERPEGKLELSDTMTSLGACFFMERSRYWEIDGLDEACGSWGQYGVEIACKSWLSGGRQVCNKRTWFAHFFRVGGIGFPYAISGGDQERAREYSRAYWRANRWPKQIHPLSWLVERFWPVPGWTDKQLADLKAGVTRRRKRKRSAKAAPFAASAADVAVPAKSKELADRDQAADPERWRTKGIVYYSDCKPEPLILEAARRTIEASRLPIVAVTLAPIRWPAASGIVLANERGILTMFRQILAGLEAISTDYVFLCEHDVLYHSSHFEFVPPRDDTYYYNRNTWKVDRKTGHALHYITDQTSGLCANRELLVRHYRARVARVEREGFSRTMGFEPGKHRPPRGVDAHPYHWWMSDMPNLDIRHDTNLTANRWRREQFRDQRNCQGWTEADSVPGWGQTKDRMDAILKGASDGKC